MDWKRIGAHQKMTCALPAGEGVIGWMRPDRWSSARHRITGMGIRKTGEFNAPEEIAVLTCDVCERDIGHTDGRRPFPHLRLTRHPNPGSVGDQNPAVI